ncbi:probable 28S ribosomal protein S26, mitochondrial [Uloborus diversus]|uniref:probable 28S ribosomal protein S26, mitochondrial n=1 Tax=Uloborus diversus TaxID=327109 RepID=UPI002409F4E7|nr:probable 28S ribosomal protein S26, mitochondrial [Uloborus diversus]
MAFSHVATRLLTRNELFISMPSCVQLRWRKIPVRKPKWKPMAASKLYRIPKHPEVSPEEAELHVNLMDEYYRKVESLRKLFKKELESQNLDEAFLAKQEEEEEKQFHLLLEENKRENERVKKIREETLEKMFQEKQIELLQLEEERIKKMELTRQKVDEIVRKEKEKHLNYITEEKLDAAIEHAIDNPININFAISINGEIKWEGNPPPEYERELMQRISEGQKR